MPVTIDAAQRKQRLDLARDAAAPAIRLSAEPALNHLICPAL
jgi:hypothetical protein